MSFKTFTEAKRGRPSKTAPAEGSEDHGPEGMEAKLRKATDYITLGREAEKAGEKNAHPKTVAIQFGNGKTHELPHEHIVHALKAIESWKGPGKNPDERMEKLKNMDKSHEHFLHTIGKMPELKKANEEVTTEARGVAPEVHTHSCVTHVYHEQFGEGKTLFSEHAEPDSDGNIAWYDVMFEHGIERQLSIDEVQVLTIESHGNHSKKKKMKEEVEHIEELNKATLRSYAAKRGSQPDAGGKGAETALALTKAAGKPPFPGMKPAKVYAKEEIEQIAEGDTMHTHTAHLSDPVSNEWKGKMLIVADNDADAIKQAQSMAKAEGLKLMKVSKNVVVMSNKAIGEEVVAEEKMCKMHGKYEGKSCSKCMTEEKQLSPKQKKIAAIAGDPTKIDAEDFKKLRSMKEEKEPKQTSHTAANRYHAVESAVRNIMSQNRDLRTEAKEAEWNKNNPKKD